MITLKYEWATIRRNELLTQLEQTRKEIDFLLQKDSDNVTKMR